MALAGLFNVRSDPIFESPSRGASLRSQLVIGRSYDQQTGDQHSAGIRYAVAVDAASGISQFAPIIRSECNAKVAVMQNGYKIYGMVPPKLLP